MTGRRLYFAGWCVGLSLLVVGPWPRALVERTAPVPRQPAPAPADLHEGPLRAGVAVVAVTDLAAGRPLAGHVGRVLTPATAMDGPIDVRALVLSNGGRPSVLLTADLLIFSRVLRTELQGRLAERGLPIADGDLFLATTHTHSAPGGWAGTFAEAAGTGRFDADLTRKLAGRMADAVAQAWRSRRPVEIRHVAVQASGTLIRNRTSGADPPNRWLDAVLLRTADGHPDGHRPLASVVVFGAHATTQKASRVRISADYPGALRDRVERSWGGRCLFVAGAVGSMGRPAAPGPRGELSRRSGEALADALLPAAGRAEGWRSDVPLASAALAADLPPATVKLSADWRASPLLAAGLLDGDARVCGLRVGDVLLLGAPADYSGTLAETLRDAHAPVTTVVTSFSGDYVGYLLPRSYDRLDAYEPRSMSFLGPDGGERFQTLLQRLAGRLGVQR